MLTKEKTDLKNALAKLEVILSRKDLELGKKKSELENVNQTLAKFNSSSSKLDTLLMMGKVVKARIWFKNSVHEVGETS